MKNKIKIFSKHIALLRKTIIEKGKILLCVISLLFLYNLQLFPQYTCGVSGLLHMPTGEMQRDGTFMIGGNFLNKHNLPDNPWWGYNTYDYYLNITFLSRLEIAYICTLYQGKNNGFWPEMTWGKYTNQDRHFAVRMNVVKETEWWEHMPSIVLGVSDPTTASGGGYEIGNTVDRQGNGFFTRWYMALTKHFKTSYGELGTHVAYLYNKRMDYPLNGVAVGANFRPCFHKNLNLIAEYDAKTFNIGAIYSLWAEHMNFIFELQKLKYISVGFVYKVNLLGGNKWNSKILE